MSIGDGQRFGSDEACSPAGERTSRRAALMLFFEIPCLTQLVLHGGAVVVVGEPVLSELMGGIGAVGILAEAGELGDCAAVHFALAIALHLLFQGSGDWTPNKPFLNSAMRIVSPRLTEPS